MTFDIYLTLFCMGISLMLCFFGMFYLWKNICEVERKLDTYAYSNTLKKTSEKDETETETETKTSGKRSHRHPDSASNKNEAKSGGGSIHDAGANKRKFDSVSSQADIAEKKFLSPTKYATETQISESSAKNQPEDEFYFSQHAMNAMNVMNAMTTSVVNMANIPIELDFLKSELSLTELVQEGIQDMLNGKGAENSSSMSFVFMQDISCPSDSSTNEEKASLETPRIEILNEEIEKKVEASISPDLNPLIASTIEETFEDIEHLLKNKTVPELKHLCQSNGLNISRETGGYLTKKELIQSLLSKNNAGTH